MAPARPRHTLQLPRLPSDLQCIALNKTGCAAPADCCAGTKCSKEGSTAAAGTCEAVSAPAAGTSSRHAWLGGGRGPPLRTMQLLWRAR